MYSFEGNKCLRSHFSPLEHNYYTQCSLMFILAYFTRRYPWVLPVGDGYPALKTCWIRVWTFEKVMGTGYPFFLPWCALRKTLVHLSYVIAQTNNVPS